MTSFNQVAYWDKWLGGENGPPAPSVVNVSSFVVHVCLHRRLTIICPRDITFCKKHAYFRRRDRTDIYSHIRILSFLLLSGILFHIFNFLFAYLHYILGPADQATEWASLDAGTRNSIKSQYSNAGISLMVSAFGSTDTPTSSGADPVGTANNMAAWVKNYNLDGIDVDYEVRFLLDHIRFVPILMASLM